MRIFLAIPILLLWVTSAAADAAKTGASLFERACLNPLVLQISASSSINEGVKASAQADKAMQRSASKAKRNGLVGKVRYKFPPNRKSGSLTCYVVSNSLTTEQITRYFGPLSQKLTGAFGKPRLGKAKIDGNPSARAEGHRATYSTKGMDVVFETIRFQSPKGPVAAFFLTIDHKTQ